MVKQDYYELLGVARDADAGAIKKSYRKIALECHPDRSPGDKAAEERFKAASEAYEVLSDPQKRQVYDQYGHRGLEGTGFHGFSGVEDVFGSFGGIFEDLFGELGFGGGHGRGRRGQRARAGADRRIEMEIAFEEAAIGLEREMQVDRTEACASCQGSGAARQGRVTCAQCGGTGQVTARQGFFVLQSTCPQCRGEGTRIETPCEDCRGHGVVRHRKKLAVKVPPGIDHQMQLVLRGEGDAGAHGGPRGDLYVLVHVAPHSQFTRDGDDILYTAAIPMAAAALGTRLTVPTLYGKRELKIPAGTEAGTVLRLKGDGVANVRSGRRGDQRVVIHVSIPKHLSKRQRQLLEAFLEDDA